MPINVLRKDLPRGTKPPHNPAIKKTPSNADSKELPGLQGELAAKEAEDMWESSEIGVLHWSGGHSNRYSDL